MDVIVNGEWTQLPKNIGFVSELLKHFQIDNKVLVIEINGEILTSLEHQTTRISDKDKIEIVHFVGGG